MVFGLILFFFFAAVVITLDLMFRSYVKKVNNEATTYNKLHDKGFATAIVQILNKVLESSKILQQMLNEEGIIVTNQYARFNNVLFTKYDHINDCLEVHIGDLVVSRIYSENNVWKPVVANLENDGILEYVLDLVKTYRADINIINNTKNEDIAKALVKKLIIE